MNETRHKKGRAFQAEDTPWKSWYERKSLVFKKLRIQIDKKKGRNEMRFDKESCLGKKEKEKAKSY